MPHRGFDLTVNVRSISGGIDLEPATVWARARWDGPCLLCTVNKMYMVMTKINKCTSDSALVHFLQKTMHGMDEK